MPPTSNIRKASLAPNGAVDLSSASGPAKRTASGRAIRSNRRPANYYARPFGSLSGPSAAAAVNDVDDTVEPPGFFPALQYFSNAVAALPREVMRQFTLMKEVEAKIHGPSEEMGGMLDKLIELPIVSRKESSRAQGGGGVNGELTAAQHAHGLLSFTASNSATGSATASLINGVGGGLHSARGSIAASAVGEEDVTEEIARRNQYRDLRNLTNSLLSNMDEKNVVLTEANRVLALQLLRVDSVLPHVESELSEEARYGSMTHWAYSDNRVKKAGLVAATRRDVAATNNLAAAANAIHETEIAQARRDAGREAHRDKAKGKRAPPVEHVDSDFEVDRPKKMQGKSAKGKLQNLAQGLGISTMGEPVKKRRNDKGPAVPAMERSNSAATNKGGKASKETARSTPTAEPSKKAAPKTKPAAVPTKKRVLNSTHNSPAMASSPLHSSFIAANMEPPPANVKPQSTRLRQNSMTNARQEIFSAAQEGSSRPASAAGAKHVGKTNLKRNVQARPDETAEEQSATRTVEQAPKRTATNDSLKREDTDIPDAAAERPHVSRSSSGKISNSNSNRDHHAAARARGQSQSKTSTPRNEQGAFGPEAPTMLRTRSTRSQWNTGDSSGGGGGAAGASPATGTRDESSASDEPKEQGASGGGGVGAGAKSGGKIRREQHQRSVSNSHLIKQLMPFNRSPDLDRGREGSEEDGEGDGGGRVGGDGDEAGDGAQVADGEKVRDGRISRPASRRNTLMRAATDGGVARTSAAPPGTADAGMEDEIEAGAHQQQQGEEEDRQDDNDEMQDVDVDDHHDAHSTALSPPPQPTTTNDPLPFPSPSPSPSASPPPALEPELTDEPGPVEDASMEEPDAELEEPEDSDHDPDDPNEPKYCYCDRGSFGEMVACDNERCAKEWFHIECTELSEAPGDDEQWFCRNCRPVGKGGRRR
ncbi:hypothetical protein LTR29_011115 [Friedmanniomyces endolithicus]|nr:hypothetical protein LTR29_011115 [Friedmanniomyces endolithicus]